jgi:hypothetical protein
VSETAVSGDSGLKSGDKPPEMPNFDKLLEPETPQVSGSSTGDTRSALSTESAPVNTSQTAMAISKPQSPATAPKLAPLAQVKQHYKDGKFKDALNVISTMRPTEITHYYAGLCYQGQGQLTQAAQEFNFVASYARDPMVKYNAQQALNTVSAYAKSRTYAGQGNKFARVTTAAPRAVRRG